MVKIKRKLFMEPGDNDWEARAVLNPAVIVEGGVEHIFYRGVSKDLVSSIGHAKIINGKLIRFDEPVLWPTERYERRGVEDPRVTKVGDTYYMLYVAFDGRNARIAYATSKNLSKWKKMGIISSHISVRKARRLVKIKKYRDKWKHQEITGFMVSLWNKDAVLFPEKIDGKFVMLHRLMPDIQVLKFRRFGDLKNDDFWADYIENLGEGEDKVSLYRRYSWEGEHIGAGAVPIKTKKGWLLIYHGVNLATGSSSKKIYHAGAALLDLKKPEREVVRLRKPLFSPKYKWEREGDKNDVVFPEGCSLKGDVLKIYYGCSDSRIGVVEMSLRELLAELGKS